MFQEIRQCFLLDTDPNIFYNEIKSIHGHDAFLIENIKMSNILKPIFNSKE